MDSSLRPTKPSIVSQLVATNEADQWTKKHVDQWKDLDDWGWELKETTRELPISGRRDQMAGFIRMQLFTSINVKGLISSGIFDQKKDERILSIIGREQLTWHLTPVVVRFHTDKEQRIRQQRARRHLHQLLHDNDLTDWKRRQSYLWVDRRVRFGK